MSLPPTLIIDDRDGERTRVDTPARRMPRRTLFSKPISVSPAGIGAIIALILAVASSAVVYRQWQAIADLRDAVVALEAQYARAASREATAFREPADNWARDVRSSAHAVGVEQRGPLERRGAELLASNDFDEALAHYRKLAAFFPSEPSFREVVSILTAKLECGSRCP